MMRYMSSGMLNSVHLLADGYGAVVQVQNRLDGRCYAIKRIPLNSTKKQLMKKITREVKLLSRLNHENVVRCVMLFH